MIALKYDRVTLNKFGITMCVAFLVIAGVLMLKHKNSLPATSIAALFILLTLAGPILLKPVYTVWMRFAFVLGWFNTRLLLLLMFYLIFTPIGLIMRLLRVDLLERKIDKARKTYWIKKENKEFSLLDYQRQF